MVRIHAPELTATEHAIVCATSHLGRSSSSRRARTAASNARYVSDLPRIISGLSTPRATLPRR